MIIIFLIGKEHNLYYINVYRGSYKHVLKIMSLDEVYQAALAAGSGGIRYNDSTKTIQLMDTDKNWVDWKKYDAYADFSYEAAVSGTYTFNYTFTKNGMYILASTWYTTSGQMSIISTATRKDFYFNHSPRNSRYFTLSSFNAINGDSLTVNTPSDYNTIILCFISGKYTTASLETSALAGGDNEHAILSMTNETNKVLIGCCSGKQTRNCTFNTTIDQDHFVTNGKDFGAASTVDSDRGSASIECWGNNGGSAFAAILSISS